MFRKEIKFIYDFNLSQVRKLGSYLTYEQIKQTDIHPAILHYISAEIDYLIFEDRQKILKDSIFDYSGAVISGHFNQIAEEIKNNKRFSIEFIAQLILHSSSFTVNYLARPRWALMKLIFEDDEHKSSTEIKQILNYVYFYGYIKKIIISYINQKKILSFDYDEFQDLLSKIDDLGFKSDYRVILNNSLQSMANFFNIGETRKNMIPVQAVELFLREKGLNTHLMKLKENFPQEEKLVFDISDYQKIFNTVRYEDSVEVEDVDRDLVEDEKAIVNEQEEYIEKEEEIESADFISNNKSQIKFQNIFEELPVEESAEEKSESIIDDITSDTETIPDDDKNKKKKEEVVESWSEEAADRESGIQAADELVAIPDEQIEIEEQIEEEKAEFENQISYEKSDEVEKEDMAAEETELAEPEEIQEKSEDQMEPTDQDDKDIVGDSSENVDDIIEVSESEIESDIHEFIIDDESDMEMTLEVVKDKEEKDEKFEGELEPDDEPKEESEEETKPVDMPIDEFNEDIGAVDEPNEEVKDSLHYQLDNSLDKNDVELESDKISEFREEINKQTPEESDDLPSDDATSVVAKEIDTGEPTLFEAMDENGKDEISEDTVLSVEDKRAEIKDETESTDAEEKLNKELVDNIPDEEAAGNEKPIIETEDKAEFDKTSIDNKTKTPSEKQIKLIIDSDDDDSEKSKNEKMKTTYEVSELLERKNMTKVIDVIFDYDIEEFANVIDRACRCENSADAMKVLDELYKRNQISPSSKEAKTLKTIISDFFDPKEN